MVSIDLICEACGEANPPGTEFCRNCNEFLAWDSATAQLRPSATAPAGGNPVTATAPTVPVTPVVEQTLPQPSADAYDQGPAQQPYADIACPSCNSVNPASRRFCAHCGYSFVAEYGTDPGVDWSGWTPQAIAVRDREARKAYRRSLPPLYRWRRVIIGVIVFALFVGLGALLRRDPVALAQGGWYRLTKEYATVAGVQAQVDPTTASANGSNPQTLVDGSVQEWTMTWTPTGESPCGAAPGTGTVTFTFPATRIRQVLIVPGLDKSNPQRDLQPQPKIIGLTLPDGSCTPVTLSNGPEQAPIEFDSKTPVTQLRLGIGSAYPAGTDAKPLISLTEVIIRSYPQ